MTEENLTLGLISYATSRECVELCGGMAPPFFNSVVGGKMLASIPYRVTPRVSSVSNHWVGGWEGPRDSLDLMENGKKLFLPGIETQFLHRQALSSVHGKLIILINV